VSSWRRGALEIVHALDDRATEVLRGVGGVRGEEVASGAARAKASPSAFSASVTPVGVEDQPIAASGARVPRRTSRSEDAQDRTGRLTERRHASGAIDAVGRGMTRAGVAQLPVRVS